MKSLIIIGGGAAGMMAALSAAENEDIHITILERQQRVGRKLLATGNGRCNLSNSGASLKDYYGENPRFILPAMDAFPPAETVRFFNSLGLVTTEQYGGRIYPLSDSANSVVDVLRYACESRGIEIISPCCVSSVKKAGKAFIVKSDSDEYRSDYLIIACGGAAGAKLGGVKDGYELLKSLGHSRTSLYPSLVPLTSNSPYPRSLKGVRADAALTLSCSSGTVCSRGELQFTDNGVSGPAVFDISRAAAVSGSGELSVNFMADFSAADIMTLLKNRRFSMPELPASELLVGIVHNKLGRTLAKYSGLEAVKPLKELSDRELKKVCSALTDFTIDIKGNGGLDTAQVTAGGIRTSEFRSDTLESRIVPGLFACGEVLDIDGRCGGFNLQWAWASGHLAGRLGK